MDWLTWEAVVAVIGSVLSVATTFFLYLMKVRTQANHEQMQVGSKLDEIVEQLEEIVERLVKLERTEVTNQIDDNQMRGNYEQLRRELESLKTQFDKENVNVKDQFGQRISDLDKRVEKLTDLLIQFLSSRTQD